MKTQEIYCDICEEKISGKDSRYWEVLDHDLVPKGVVMIRHGGDQPRQVCDPCFKTIYSRKKR